MRRSKYSTDLSDSEWACLKPHLPASKKRGRGRPRIHSLRDILDAIFFYVLKSGCPWRLLPRCFPPCKSVYHWFEEVEHRRDLRAPKHGAARALACTAGKKPTAQCGDSRFSVSQDERSGRRTARVRRRQESSRPKAAPARGYGRLGPQSKGTQCQGARPGRHQATSEGRPPTPSTPLSSMGGRRLPGQGQRVGRAGARAECRGRASHAETDH